MAWGLSPLLPPSDVRSHQILGSPPVCLCPLSSHCIGPLRWTCSDPGPAPFVGVWSVAGHWPRASSQGWSVSRTALGPPGLGGTGRGAGQTAGGSGFSPAAPCGSWGWGGTSSSVRVFGDRSVLVRPPSSGSRSTSHGLAGGRALSPARRHPFCRDARTPSFHGGRGQARHVVWPRSVGPVQGPCPSVFHLHFRCRKQVARKVWNPFPSPGPRTVGNGPGGPKSPVCPCPHRRLLLCTALWVCTRLTANGVYLRGEMGGPGAPPRTGAVRKAS